MKRSASEPGLTSSISFNIDINTSMLDLYPCEKKTLKNKLSSLENIKGKREIWMAD